MTAVSPQIRTFIDRIEVLGAAKARQSVNVTAPAQQLITRIRFQSGDYVRSGQVLAELKAQEQDAGIVQAQSQVKFAKSTWDRWQQLSDRGIAPAATAEQYKAAYDQAVANLDAAKARLGDRVIRAPFSGTVGLSDAAPGMLVNPGATIATLDDMSVMRVDFPVPERFIPVLKDGLAIAATADAYPANTFQGRVAKVDTRLDPGSRSVVARAEFPNKDGRLKPGMLLHVTIENAVRQNPAIPEPAVVFENGEAYVLLIQPAPPGQGGQGGQAGGFAAQGGRPPPGAQAPPGGGQTGGFAGGQAGQGGQGGQRQNLIAVRHVIGTGLRQDGFVEITSGLQPGQRIVADGTNKIRPNDPVQIAGGGQGFAGQGFPRQGGGFGGGQGPPGQGGFGGGVVPGGQAGARPDMMATFTAADTNKDGSVTAAEWTASGRPEGFFTRLDANGDGKITRAEMQAFVAARAAGGGAPSPGPAPASARPTGGPPAAGPAGRQAGVPPGGPGGAPGGQGVRPDPMAMFASADADKDGVVTLAEWTAAGRPEGFFTRLDANGDGKITRSEMQAFTAGRGAGGPPGGGFQRPPGGPNG